MAETSASLGTQFIILRHQEHAKKAENAHLNEISRPKNIQLAVRRSVLFTKLTYALSRGYYRCVYKMLKAKLDKDKSLFEISQISPNEQASEDKLWLQMETNRTNKKFLLGKTPLILCTYLQESRWGMTLSRLLLENGAHLSLRDSTNGCYPIHYACALLKVDLIHLYFRNLNLNLENTRDFYYNTPLVYFMVAFYYYVKAFLNKNRSTSRSGSNLKVRFELSSSLSYTKESVIKSTPTNEDDDADTISYTAFTNNDADEANFQKSVVGALQTYLNHLTHLEMKINTKNKFGLSVQDLYNAIIESQSVLAKHEFFILIRRALSAQNQNNSQLSNYVDKPGEPENKDATVFSIEELHVKPAKVHFTQLSSKSALKLTSSSANLSKAQSFNSRSNNNSSLKNYPFMSPTPTPTLPDFNSSSFRSSSIDSLVRFHLLIPIDEIKQCGKLITHSTKIDNDLIYHFYDSLKREQAELQKSVETSAITSDRQPKTARRAESLNSSRRPPRPQTAAVAPALSRASPRKPKEASLYLGEVESDEEPEMNEESLLSKTSGLRPVNFTWRNRLEEYFANIQISQSGSFRKSAVRKAPDPSELNEQTPNGKNGSGSVAHGNSNPPVSRANGETSNRRQPSRMGSSMSRKQQSQN